MAVYNGYSVDAYCDCEQCKTQTDANGKYAAAEMISASGETYAECAAEIRSFGWYLSRDRTRAIAPCHTITVVKNDKA